jgi:hypothetical protein
MFKNLKTAELQDTRHEVVLKADAASVKRIYKSTIKAALILTALSVAAAITTSYADSKFHETDDDN